VRIILSAEFFSSEAWRGQDESTRHKITTFGC
jgi:hypothetical protein